MPTYVYRFVDTDETIEIQQPFSDPTLTEVVHPSTGATMAVKKVFQPVGVTFKGDGFYKTDSRSGKKAASPGATDGAASTSKDASTADSSSSDTKTDTKTDTTSNKKTGTNDSGKASATPKAAPAASGSPSS